jgi:hypothetical protein
MSYREGAYRRTCHSYGPWRLITTYATPSLAICVLVFSAAADTPPSAEPKAHLDTITVEAARHRETVERQVRTFVSGIAVARRDESLANWQSQIPVCLLVAGLPRADGEYMLRRLSQIAMSAGAPLAPEHCKPNFFIVVTSKPEALLKAWSKRDTTMFGNEGGIKIQKFLNGNGPIRVWYNVELYNSDGTPLGHGDANSDFDIHSVRINLHAMGSRIRFDDVRDLSSVIVLVDAPRAKGISFGQLAAYVGMVGFAEIKVDAKVSGTPSILQLFSGSGEPAPPGLTVWDEAFLKELYHTEHLDQRQISAIRTAMVGDIAP